MKQMILTGIATEQSFTKPDAEYYLVFNGGGLRIPCSEEAAQVVVKAMYGGGSAEPELDDEGGHEVHEDMESSSWEPPGSFVTDEDGVEQA